ncbi:hypothetical protein SVIOM342S_07642 [Streptomyces violaceorubidus]
MFAAAAAHDRLTDEAERAAAVAVDVVERQWLKPEAGLWELENRWWTHSRLSVVCGLRRMAQALPGPRGAPVRRPRRHGAAVVPAGDSRGWVLPRSFDDRRGFLPTYRPGTVVEIDLGRGRALRHYDAERIAEAVAQCHTVHLVSALAGGDWPHIEHGTAYNADGALHLLRLAIGRAAHLRSASAC